MDTCHPTATKQYHLTLVLRPFNPSLLRVLPPPLPLILPHPPIHCPLPKTPAHTGPNDVNTSTKPVPVSVHTFRELLAAFVAEIY